jgi:hypothetical protein
LNHAPGGVTAVYNRWASLPEKRRALEARAADISPNMTNI